MLKSVQSVKILREMSTCAHTPPPTHTMGRKQRVPWGVSRCLCETVPYLLESAVLQFGGGMVVDLLAEVLVA